MTLENGGAKVRAVEAKRRAVEQQGSTYLRLLERARFWRRMALLSALFTTVAGTANLGVAIVVHRWYSWASVAIGLVCYAAAAAGIRTWRRLSR